MYAIVYMFLHQFQVPIFITDYLSVLVPYIFTSFSNTSGYCNCPICCGVWSGGPTASGAMPQANHTLAVDAANPFLPMGTKVVMNGIEYTVEDTGNFAQYGVQFDVYYDNHAVAEAHGHQTWECFLAEGNQNSVEVTRTVTADVLNVSVQAKPLRSVILSRMEEDEQEIYEEVYSNRGNLQTSGIYTNGARCRISV